MRATFTCLSLLLFTACGPGVKFVQQQKPNNPGGGGPIIINDGGNIGSFSENSFKEPESLAFKPGGIDASTMSIVGVTDANTKQASSIPVRLTEGICPKDTGAAIQGSYCLTPDPDLPGDYNIILKDGSGKQMTIAFSVK